MTGRQLGTRVQINSFLKGIAADMWEKERNKYSGESDSFVLKIVLRKLKEYQDIVGNRVN